MADPVPPTAGQIRIEALRNGGFDADEIQSYVDRRSLALIEGGFTEDDVDEFWGGPEWSDDRVNAAAEEYIREMIDESWEERGIWPSIVHGFSGSIPGMLAAESAPAPRRHSGRVERIAGQAGMLAGDIIPMLLGGALTTGSTANPVTGLAGAFALPAGVKQVLMDRYTKGEAADLGEIWDRLTAALWETGKGATVGAATGITGGVASGFARGAGLTGVGAAIPTTAAEIGAMVTVGAAVEGETPTMEEFIDATILIGALKAATKTPTLAERFAISTEPLMGRLRRTYVRTSKRPDKVVEEAIVDRTIKEDLQSVNQDVPRSHQSAARTEVDPVILKAAEFVTRRQDASVRGLRRGLGIQTRAEAEMVLSRLEELGVVGEAPAFGVKGERAVLHQEVASAQQRVKSDAVVEKAGEQVEPLSAARKKEPAQVEAERDVARLDREIATLEEAVREFETTGEGILRDSLLIETKGRPATKADLIKGMRERISDMETRREEQRAKANPPEPQAAAEPAVNPRLAEAKAEMSEVLAEARKLSQETPQERQQMGSEFIEKQDALLGKADALQKEIRQIELEEVRATRAEATRPGEVQREAILESLEKEHSGATQLAQKMLTMTEQEMLDAGLRLPTQSKADVLKKQQARRAELETRINERREAAGEAPIPPKPATPFEDARNQILGHIDIGEARTLRNLPGRIRTGIREFSLDEWYTNWVDRLHPLNVVLKELHGTPEIPAIDNFYKLARLHMGVAGKANHFLEFSPFEYETSRKVGRPLRAILDPVKEPTKLDDLRIYGTARRAIELDKRGIETGIDRAAAELAVKRLGKEMDPVFKELLEYQEHVLNYLRDSGIVSKERVEVMRALNEDYIPFHRLYEVNAKASGTPAALKVTDPTFRIKGSSRKIHDPLEAIIKNTYVMIELAERNGVINNFIDTVAMAARTDIAMQVKKTNRPIKLNAAEKKSLLKKIKGDEAKAELTKSEQAFLEETFSIFRPENTQVTSGQVVRFKNGVREVWEVDPLIAEVFNVMTRESATTVGRFLAAPARLLRAGAILAPEFVARNPIRDTMVSFLQSDSGFRFLVDTTFGAFEVIKKGEIYEEWLRSGGPMAELVALDRTYQQKTLRQLTEDTGLIRRTRNVLLSPIEALRAASTLSEQATRVGEFRRATQKGREGGRQLTKGEILEAGFRSREVSLDFGRIGAKAQALNSIIAFFNAQVQGVDKMVRVMKEHPGRTATRGIVSMTLPTMLLHAHNQDEPGYDEIPRYQKDLFWVFRAPFPSAMLPDSLEDKFTITGASGEPEDVWWRLPKPFQFGMLFATLPERVMDRFLKDDPHAYSEWLESFGKMSLPGIVPTAAVPPLETWANKSLHTGRAIVPRNREGGLSQYAYTPYTTELSKALGAFLGQIPGLETAEAVQPAVIENVVRGWTGGLGVHFMQLADKALQGTGFLPDDVAPDTGFDDMPFIKAFKIRHPSAGSESVQDFWEESAVVVAAAKSMTALIAAEEFDAADELMDRMEFELELSDLVANVRATIGGFSAQIRAIDMDPEMPRDEKEDLITEFYWLRIEVAKAGLEVIRETMADKKIENELRAREEANR